MFVSESASTWRHPWLAGLGMGLQWMAAAVVLADSFGGGERISVPVRIVVMVGMLVSGVLMVVGMRQRPRPSVGTDSPRADAASR